MGSAQNFNILLGNNSIISLAHRLIDICGRLSFTTLPHTRYVVEQSLMVVGGWGVESPRHRILHMNNLFSDPVYTLANLRDDILVLD